MTMLESNQVYGEGKYLNPKDHPAERQEEKHICGLCCVNSVEEEGVYCKDCQNQIDEDYAFYREGINHE